MEEVGEEPEGDFVDVAVDAAVRLKPLGSFMK